MDMKTKRSVVKVVCFCIVCFATQVKSAEIYKADNALPLNDPLSWEGGVAPAENDIAVFSEGVTTNTSSFLITNDLTWAGLIITNQSETVSNTYGNITLATDGIDIAVLTLGADGVSLENSGMNLVLDLPLALNNAQTWQIDNMNLTFNDAVSGTSDWTIDTANIVNWNKASGYNGHLTCANFPAGAKNVFHQSGRWADSFDMSNCADTRWEMRFADSVLWSDLFSSRMASVDCWNGITSGGTLQFEEGDSFQFSSSSARFTLDNGYCVQNGGTLSGYELQVQYGSYSARYTMNGGSLDLTGSILLGNGLSALLAEGRFLQNGGTVATPRIKDGWGAGHYQGVPTYELRGGELRISGTRNADTGVHLSWNEYGNAYDLSAAFLMSGGFADIDQISLGRSTGSSVYAVTNGFALFKMTGGELVLGSRGFYAGRSWNNGIAGSGYAYKLEGGTLTAGDSFSSSLDLFLSDSSGGTAFNTADANGVGQRVILNGAVYGPGSLTKQGEGTLVLAGKAAYSGNTIIEQGTLAVVGGCSADCYRWTADSLTNANNASIMEWMDVNNSVSATGSDSSHSPSLVCNEINGHSVLRFNNSSSQYMTVAAEDSPISGATSFSIAVVFKTGTAGASTGDKSNWFRHTGLIDAEQGGVLDDWGMCYNDQGQVCGGAGFPPTGDKSVYSSSSYSVVDSQPHVAIYTWEGTNLEMNVDGRVTAAYATAGSVNPRNTYRMLFGSMDHVGDKYFNGDIAEIRIWRNYVLSQSEQDMIGNGLAAEYGVQDAVFSEPASLPAVAGEISSSGTTATNSLSYEVVVWDADTLTGTNASVVSEWTSTNGSESATLDAATVLDDGYAISGRTAPILTVEAINGHNVVSFDGSHKNVLGIPAGDNPVANVTNYSVALVFRTTAAGVMDTRLEWWQGTGLIDAEQPGATHDWGISFSDDGRVCCGIGGPDATSFSKPFDLHDGAPHVAVVSFDALGGSTTVMVDGLPVKSSSGVHSTPRNIKRLLLGSVNGVSGHYYSGDIATCMFFPETALSGEEMTSLSSELACKYNINLMPGGNTIDPQPSGLGSGDVEVYAGASLTLPQATNSPVTLVSQIISGGGRVNGTLALAEDAVLDMGLSETLSVEELWLQDGSTVRWNHSSGTGNTLVSEMLKTSGTVTVEVVGGTDLPARIPIIAYTTVDGWENTSWIVTGGKGNTQIQLNEQDKTLDLVTAQGMIIMIR